MEFRLPSAPLLLWFVPGRALATADASAKPQEARREDLGGLSVAGELPAVGLLAVVVVVES